MILRWLGAACIVVSVAAGCALWHWVGASRIPRPSLDESMVHASVGDVVFFCTRTWRGRLVRLLDDGKDDFTHVGVVVRSEGRNVYVVHASPGEGDMVRVDRLADLLAREEITGAAIYRPRIGESDAWRAADVASRYAAARTPFDHEFRLEDDRSVYCTELVWYSYRHFGLHIHASGRIVFPSDLIESGFFEARARTSNRSHAIVSFSK